MDQPQAPSAADPEALLKEVRGQLDPTPAEAWPALRRRLASLLQEGPEAKDFRKRLAFIETGLALTLEGKEDDSLFVLVQMLANRDYGYNATHALTAAVLCRMVGPLLAQMDDATLNTLVRAALTMNIAMARLQDQLAVQAQPVSDTQRDDIRAHPHTGAQWLQRLGVDDPLWLELVQDHHETPDGHGYPQGKAVQNTLHPLLRMCDIFIARISPRVNRRGLWPNLAVGHLFKEAQAQSSPLGAAFAKQLGLYPPGSYVRLKTQEIAVVVRRGDRVNTPLTLSITDPDGLPVSTPRRRDTHVPAYRVLSPVSPEDVRIRLDLARLLKRV